MTDRPEPDGPEPEDDRAAALQEWYDWHLAEYGEEPELAEGDIAIPVLNVDPRYL